MENILGILHPKHKETFLNIIKEFLFPEKNIYTVACLLENVQGFKHFLMILFLNIVISQTDIK